MRAVPAKVAERLIAGLKQFQPVIESAKARDVNESDTVIIVTDLLSELFGYDKYSELTSEYSIRGTFCDLATKLDGKLQCLIEVKAVGSDLKDAHTKQATDYAANEGIEWVVLTNGAVWRVYRVIFSKPVDHELVVEFDVTKLNPKAPEDVQTLYLLAREGWAKSALDDFDTQRQALSRFCIGAMLLTDPVLRLIRRQLKRMSPDAKIDAEQIKNVLIQDVLKRDVLEGEKADGARRKVNRSTKRALKAKAASTTQPPVQPPLAK